MVHHELSFGEPSIGSLEMQPPGSLVCSDENPENSGCFRRSRESRIHDGFGFVRENGGFLKIASVESDQDS